MSKTTRVTIAKIYIKLPQSELEVVGTPDTMQQAARFVWELKLKCLNLAL